MVISVEQIEKEISQLPQDQLMKFREWYEKFDSNIWDQQLENDAKNGKLDSLANAAIAEHQAGKTKEL